LVKQEPTLLKNLSDAPLRGRLLALPANNRLSWIGLQGTNTLAYYENSQLKAVKSFIILAPANSMAKLKQARLLNCN
jgi:hypothetical protein